MPSDHQQKENRGGTGFLKPKVVVSGTPMPSSARNIKLQGENISATSINALEFSRRAKNRKYSVYTRRRNAENLMLTIITPIAIVGVVLGIILVFRYCSTPCNFPATPTEQQVVECQRATDGKECIFDTSTCAQVCLLGYKQDQYACPISCECATEGIFESDIKFNPNNIQSILLTYLTNEDNTFHITNKYSSVSIHQKIWNEEIVNGRPRVPYVFSFDIYQRNSAIKAINEAINELSRKTCVDFVPRLKQSDFVEFITRKSGCSSFVGRIGGRQTLTVGEKCEYSGTIQHELLHVIAFWHEQSRPDRDHHVIIDLDNVSPAFRHNFKARGRDSTRNFGSPYDGNSILHYDGHTFSSNSRPTVLNRTTKQAIKAQREAMTHEDLNEVNKLYLCTLNTTVLDRQLADHWSAWTSWGDCSASCSTGHKYRIHDCKNAADVSVYSGRCEGSQYEAQECAMPPCEQGKWGPWSSCSRTCGQGLRIRESCCHPISKYEQAACNVAVCGQAKELGSWLTWQPWEICSHTCGVGWRRRRRDCVDRNRKVLSIRECPWKLPMASEFMTCNTEACGVQDPNAGFWHAWDSWSTCSETCGIGIQMRHRECVGNQPGEGGCRGDDDDMQICEWTVACPREESIATNWGPWTSWTLCSASCDRGHQRRERHCYGYVNSRYVVTTTCLGDNLGKTVENQNQTCTVKICGSSRKVIGVKSASMPDFRGGTPPRWSEWTFWHPCTKSCDMGMTWRKRDCLLGRIGGKGCESKFHDVKTCNTKPCHVLLEWGEWSHWSVCSKWCYGTRRRHRQRECADEDCASLPATDIEYCNTACTITSDMREKHLSNLYGRNMLDRFARKWSEWAVWGHCSKSCNSGVKWRKRECLFGKIGERGCEDSAHDIISCNTHACELPKFTWSRWSSWSRCSSWCHGKSKRTRRRRCIPPSKCDTIPVVVWENCNMKEGDLPRYQHYAERSADRVPDCLDTSHSRSHSSDSDRLMVSAKWSRWSSWGRCTKSCGIGRRWRKRKCLFGRVGSSGCEDSSFDIKLCNTQACELLLDGWHEWLEWSACSKSCRGVRFRRRDHKCQVPGNCSIPFTTNQTETEECNTKCSTANQRSFKSWNHALSRTTSIHAQAMWSRWSPWGLCTKFCDSGVRWRKRRCIYGRAGQKGCEDSTISVASCNKLPCSSPLFRLTEWTNWTICSKNCHGETWRVRKHECVSPKECPSVPSNSVQNTTRRCNTACSTFFKNRQRASMLENPLGLPPQWTGWSVWMQCTKSCGGGVRWRKRKCMFGKIGSKGCEESVYDIKACNSTPCTRDPSKWDQTSIFCDQNLQVLDINGDDLSDLVCVRKQNMSAMTPGFPQANKMTVAINNGDTTFEVKEVNFKAELFNVECGNPFTEAETNYTENASNMDVIFRRHRWMTGSSFASERSELNSRGFHSWYRRKFAYRHANKGLCGEDFKTSAVERQMVSFLDGGVHVFCYDSSGMLKKVFMNLTLDDGV